MSNQLPGGWSPFHDLSDEDREVFLHGVEGITGVTYKPIAVSEQVVAGCNYAFFCNAEIVYPDAPTYPAMVTMFKDLNGKVGVTHIQRLEC